MLLGICDQNMSIDDDYFSGVPNLWTKSWFLIFFGEESLLVNYIYGGMAQGSHKFKAICNWWKFAPLPQFVQFKM